jgi:glycine dehydrogenase subunit 2
VHEVVARLPGFSGIHPLQEPATVQGALALIYHVEQALAEIAGMLEATIQPAAGAHGELLSLMMIRAFHQHCGQETRKVVLIPDSAHGTNPASAARCGFAVRSVPTDRRGLTDLAALEAALGPTTAALMLTNPNTLGLFERDVIRICQMVHKAGGLVYCDGANMNAIVGVARPGDMGFDVMHFNLHKTFSTPHGGGGPGAGATAVTRKLAPFLPAPIVAKRRGTFYLDYDRPKSIGRVRAFYGNFGVMVRAYAYIRSLGAKGLRGVSENAVLNANYIRVRLNDAYDIAYDRTCMHECVFSGKRQAKLGVRTLDIAKRLIDFGVHPPTIYFPLIVEEALMIEPTETESRQSCDKFIEAMLQIAREAETNPDVIHSAPHRAPVSRLDEVGAARKPNLRWTR